MAPVIIVFSAFYNYSWNMGSYKITEVIATNVIWAIRDLRAPRFKMWWLIRYRLIKIYFEFGSAGFLVLMTTSLEC